MSRAMSPRGPLPTPQSLRRYLSCRRGLQALPGFSVINGQRPAAKKVVRPRRRPTGGIDPLKGDEELSQRARELPQIGDTLDRRDLAVKPTGRRTNARGSPRRASPSRAGQGWEEAGAAQVLATSGVPFPLVGNMQRR
jgi:hypothetical protein